ncbi:MAG: 50S ribosomal protein L31e [Candidatus Woesearchaeota archaeon]
MTEIKREYNVPLRRGFANTPRYKRTHKAIRVLKEFLIKNMKSDNIKLGKRLNEFMWKNGIQNPPCKVSVVAIKDKDNLVKVELAGFDYVDFKPISDEEPKNLKEKLQEKVKGPVRDAEGELKKPKTEAKPKTEKKETKKAEPKEEEKLIETEVKEEELLEDKSE